MGYDHYSFIRETKMQRYFLLDKNSVSGYMSKGYSVPIV